MPGGEDKPPSNGMEYPRYCSEQDCAERPMPLKQPQASDRILNAHIPEQKGHQPGGYEESQHARRSLLGVRIHWRSPAGIGRFELLLAVDGIT